MQELSPISLVVEGDTDEFVISALLDSLGISAARVYGKKGKAYIVERIDKYNRAAEYAPWLVVVDLDNDALCAPDYVQTLLPEQSAGMIFRVAVRSIEAWLLADYQNLSRYLGISEDLFPRAPDTEENPKRTLVNLARRSNYTAIREDLVPRQGSGVAVGPGYLSRIAEFLRHQTYRWSPEPASMRSESLRSAIDALNGWRAYLRNYMGDEE